jgi:hypothetical protein
LSTLRGTFAVIIAVNRLICADVCARWRMTLRRQFPGEGAVMGCARL